MNKGDKAVIVKDVSKAFTVPTSVHQTVQSHFVNPFEKRESHTFTALDGVTFDVRKGEFFSVIGRNGSGKSTLFKVIAGIYEPDTGKVTVKGKLVPFLELGVGFHPELSALENVYLNSILLGMERERVDAYVDEIFEFANLQDFREVSMKNYSSGMQVRLAFSIAIRLDSEILLLDEVLAVGDAEFQQKCFDYFEKIVGKKTILFVSHDLNSVKKYSDRVLYLRGDKTYEVTSPKKAVESYMKDIETES